MAVIGFKQTAYTFEEGDGTVAVCAALLDPNQTAPNVVIELMGSTSPSTYPACCVNVYSTVASQKSTHEQSTLQVCQRGGFSAVSSVSRFNHKRLPVSYVYGDSMSLNQII